MEPSPASPVGRWTSRDALAAAFVSACALLVFLNTLGHGWILDDHHQVLRNRFIQEWPLHWRALTSDVWSFYSGDDRPASNYWRPTFVLWNIVLWKIAGPGVPMLWHLANVLLHAANTLLCFRVCRLLGVGTLVAAFIALIFACHPTRTESVAWVGGATDLILGFFVLLTLASMLRSAGSGDDRSRRRWYLLGCLACLPALGSKEVAILLPLPIAVIGAFTAAVPTSTPIQALRARARAACNWALAPSLLAAGYLAVRTSIMRGGFMKPNGEVSAADAIASFPDVLAWYLHKSAWPHPVMPMYAFDVTTPDQFSLSHAGVSIAVCAAVALSALALAVWHRKDHSWPRWVGPGSSPPWPGASSALVPWFGGALFVSMLAPAMNIAAYSIEQPVHDRYLYLPLFGLLLLTIPALAGVMTNLKAGLRIGTTLAFACAAAYAALLTVQTIAYNRAWVDELTVWTVAVELEPRSSIAHRLKGQSLANAGRFEEARRSFETAIERQNADTLNGLPRVNNRDAHVGLAMIEIEAGRPDVAERLLRQVAADLHDRLRLRQDTSIAGYLAVALDRQGRVVEAEQVLRAAINESPQGSQPLLDKLAACLYKQGRKDDAREVLEQATRLARAQPLPGTHMAFYRLGLLNAEQGRRAEAIDNLTEFLGLTRTHTQRAMIPTREHAVRVLLSLGAPVR